MADVVAIRIQGEPTAPTGIEVEFYHCKYSGGPDQDSGSMTYMRSVVRPRRVFGGCVRRKSAAIFLRICCVGERIVRRRVLQARYEVGDAEMLQTIREMSHLAW